MFDLVLLFCLHYAFVTGLCVSYPLCSWLVSTISSPLFTGVKGYTNCMHIFFCFSTGA